MPNSCFARYADIVKNIFSLVLFLFAVLIFPLFTVHAEPKIPPAPTSNYYVQDQADMLSADTEKVIEAYGQALQAKTKAQLVVLTVNSLEGATVEEYGLAVLRGWGIGDRELNNGVLLLVSKNDRRFRIEVGYGLEGAINDGAAGRILADYLKPAFKQSNYDKGVLDTYAALLDRTLTEYKLTRKDLGVSESFVLRDIKAEEAELAAYEEEEESALDWIYAAIFMLIGGSIIMGFWWLVINIFDAFFSLFGSGCEGGGGDSDGGGGGGGGYGGGSGGGGGASGGW